MKKLTVLDLFCGCGGMSWGLHKAGARIVAGIDNWAHGLRTFKRNHPEAEAIKADLTGFGPDDLQDKVAEIKDGSVDCIVGGPPCQGFSKNVPAAYRFLEDPRNQLFKHFMLFVDALRPVVVLMENVAEIHNAYDGRVRNEICERLLKLGYRVEAKILNAADFGVPQKRRRCFFFASRGEVAPRFPTPTHDELGKSTLFGKIQRYVSAWSAISDLPVLHNGEGSEPMPYDKEPQNAYQQLMRRDSNELWDHITRRLNDRQMARIQCLKPGQGIKDLPPDIRPNSGYSGAYGRLDFDMVAPTITRWVFHPGSGRYCHPREVRLLTMREAARVQSFSDDFRFTGSFVQKAGQIGNAVPPLVVNSFAEKIRECCLVPCR
jgi:DNA (cytosine-5)-methyltransferase 1